MPNVLNGPGVCGHNIPTSHPRIFDSAIPFQHGTSWVYVLSLSCWSRFPQGKYNRMILLLGWRGWCHEFWHPLYFVFPAIKPTCTIHTTLGLHLMSARYSKAGAWFRTYLDVDPLATVSTLVCVHNDRIFRHPFVGARDDIHSKTNTKETEDFVEEDTRKSSALSKINAVFQKT